MSARTLGLLVTVAAALLLAGCGEDGSRARTGFRNDFLIETEELVRMLGRPGVVIIDARPDEDYRKAHVPGAVRLARDVFRRDEDLKNILVYKAKHGFPIPPDVAERLFSEAGVDENSKVVVYDSMSFPDASAVWATLTYFGHPDVRVLNGGYEKWVAEGRPVTAAVPEPVRRRFRARPDEDMVAGRDWLLANKDRVVVLDMRSLGEYAGIDTGELSRGGHIPGAVSVEWKELAGSGTVKPAAEIRRILREKGIDDPGNREVVTYCNIGVGRSTYGFMVLRALGFDKVRVYSGSFEDWTASGETQVLTDRVGSRRDWLR